MLSLVGELTIARSRLERRTAELERVGAVLDATRARVTSAFGEFERKYADPTPLRGGTAWPGPEPATAAAPPSLDGAFGELEFDRYDDFNIMARRAGEIAADVAEIQGQLGGLVRRIRDDAERVQRLGGALRSEIGRARMVPLGRLFARFARQVREAARAAGKAIALEATGEAVEIDNAVIEQITDPLLHLLQNAVTHGIEPEAERVARGKPPHGTVRLTASHQGGVVRIEVADDGRGIDLAAVRDAALRGGFLAPAALEALDERDVLDLIFLPGLSTAAVVTTAAGRGVGMDVVRTNVGRMGGEIQVESEAGAGTRFTLRLPATVALADSLLVRVGAETFAVPVPSVRALARVPETAIRGVDGAETVEVDGQREDLVRLDRRLGIAGSRGDEAIPVAVLRTGRRSIAVAVDELIGRQEIVVRNLGAFMDGAGPFAGATVTGEGRVILLLDPLTLAETRWYVPPVPPAAPRGGAGATRPAPRVLLVDDSVSVRRVVGGMLERAGFAVVTANDGVEALERVAHAGVDAVVTDLEMPRLNGYDLIRDLRRRPETRELPVVVLTTRAGEKHVALARRLGIEHYMTKPVDESALVRLLAGLAAAAPAPVGA
jgi:chemosensory pili system protein ChpA (sensor histidine kinase/response regulator)